MYQTLFGLIPRPNYQFTDTNIQLKMTTDTHSESTTPKTTTVARVATTGPAAATGEARKNRINRLKALFSTEDTGDTPPVVIPVLHTLTVMTVSVPAEGVRVENTDANATIDPYSPSEPDDSPPRFSIPMPAYSSHSEGTIPSRAPYHLPQINTSSLRIPVATAVERSNHLMGQILRRGPLNKYTEATMPAIYDASPYAPLRHMDLEQVDVWENCPGSKLFAHPFDDVSWTRELNEVKMRIFSAAIEITNSQRVAVSPPRPSQAAIEADCVPTCFLIYNLSADESQLLLERTVWSSTNITFRVTSFYPAFPDFLFSIKGLATTHTDSVYQIVHSVWHDDATESFLDSIIEDSPQDERANTNQAISQFIASMRVTLLPVKAPGNILVPRFNVYANGSPMITQAAWKRLRNYLADRTYASSMLGNGIAELAPYRCGICCGVDHPMGLCPFPDIKGWNGPKKPRFVVEKLKSRARGGQSRGSAYRTARR